MFGLTSHGWQSSLTKAIDDEGGQSSDFGEREVDLMDSVDDDGVQGKAQALFTKQESSKIDDCGELGNL